MTSSSASLSEDMSVMTCGSCARETVRLWLRLPDEARELGAFGWDEDAGVSAAIPMYVKGSAILNLFAGLINCSVNDTSNSGGWKNGWTTTLRLAFEIARWYANKSHGSRVKENIYVTRDHELFPTSDYSTLIRELNTHVHVHVDILSWHNKGARVKMIYRSQTV